MFAELASRREDGVDLEVLVYRFETTLLGVSSAVAGGGIGERHWAFNAQVPSDYGREDVSAHVSELADALGLEDEGVGMLTAAKVRRREHATVEGVFAEATTGLSHPTWAADDNGEPAPPVGTINTVIFVPARLSDGALVNAVATATEAKSQALFEAGIPATGTASDAIALFCPREGDVECFCGPRSLWGARIARAVHQAIFSGAQSWAP
ncbi:MAG TPA: adenosylcobinamide amidohydrolase [Acidimicrobiales bacterium]|jgi:adenosylcobinamide amidohydrolase|nr:adenosylcobinamide amidohydrolase [Acidimicrobiales bacterium]